MKTLKHLVSLILICTSCQLMYSCKNEAKTESTQENRSTEKNKAVIIEDDNDLERSVDKIVMAYKDVKAEVKDGVVTLKGKVSKAQLDELIRDIQELRPKRVENNLEIE